MAKHQPLTEAEREQRRAADRERVKRAAQELLTSEGWTRWLRSRQLFHAYSASNCMLLALQFHERGIDPEQVAGFRTWLKLGRSVRRGEKSLKVMAPITIRTRADSTTDSGERDGKDDTRVLFKTASVFSISQTEPLPGAEQLPLSAPCEPLTGDSHAHLIEPLIAFAATLDYTVSIKPAPGAARGWCDANAKQIVIDANQCANGQVRTLVHELVHALGVDYKRYRREQAEVIVDTATLVVLGAVGLDTSGETIPYVAGWGESGALEAVTEFAGLIDQLARTVERAILPANNNTSDSAELAEAA